jgi:putative transposase
MMFQFMEDNSKTYEIQNMCDILKVSKSGYYAWKTRQPSPRQKENEQLLGRIRQIHTESRNLYGSPRITAVLKEEGLRYGKTGLLGS